MRRKIVAGNWKMNLVAQEAGQLTDDIISLSEKEKISSDVELILFPPFPYLDFVGSKLAGHKKLQYGAQNCASQLEGAYTGEVSAKILCSIGVNYVIVGHSERRKYFGEDSEVLSEKIIQVLNNSLTPIFCCGELLEERKKDKHFSVIENQLSEALFQLKKSEFSKLVIAYEPVWAIGTGETATPKQAQEMHAFIRNTISEKYGSSVADKIPLLYGGSVNEKNAADLFNQKDVDGGLIGGASLKAKNFIAIAKSY